METLVRQLEQPSVSGRDLPVSTVRKAYGHWAAFYDALCGPVFRPAHRAAACAASNIGGDVLEVGVGTGLVLPLYEPHLRVRGVDLSDSMLAKARDRLSRSPLAHVHTLEVGDIHTLAHSDRSYDAIVFPFVLTLVAMSETALDNCRRMLRTGGEIIVVSRFQSRKPWLAACESRLAPYVARLGLRPDFPVSRLAAWAACHPDMELVATEPAGTFGVYTCVRLRKHERQTPRKGAWTSA